MKPNFKDITVENDHQPHENKMWEKYGVLYLPKVIPDLLIENYIYERKLMIGGSDLWRPGWPDATPYMRVPSMKAIATHRELTEIISTLIGDEPGLHLCLTGFQSTERAWHQDRYLNPENVGERYIAAWMALDDIHAASGPFEYVPGSHLWPVIERRRVWEQMKSMGQDSNLSSWPSDSQGWVGDACQAEIDRLEAPVIPFIANRGDVLLWHASLMHRGSKPVDPVMERRALICHYSAITARPDMPPPVRQENGSWFFPF